LQGTKQKKELPFETNHYTSTQIHYIGAVAHLVSENAPGYKQYEGKLLHWHIVAGFTAAELEADGKLPDNLHDTPAYHYDNQKPYLGTHQINVLVDIKNYHIPADSPPKGHIFFKLLKPVKASQIEGNVIKIHNLHQYEYNGEYSGCLCWTRTFLKCLAKDGYIDPGAVAQFEKVVTTLRGMNYGPDYYLYTVPVDDGTFFKKQGTQYVDYDPAA
jgi:hypothetical protein